MECEQARKLMHAFIDKEINDHETNKLNEHLDACESCTVEFEEIKYMVQLMGEIDLKELPLGFENELHEKLIIASREMETEKPFSNQKRWFEGIIERLSHFKIKRSFYAYAAIPAIMVVMIIATKGLFLGQSKGDSASMEAYDGLQDTTVSFVYGEALPGVPEESANAKGSTQTFTSDPVQIETDNLDHYREGRLIIQTASLRMDVEKYDDVMTSIKSMVTDLGGYIENESTAFKNYNLESEKLKYGVITIRMPATAYLATLNQIKGLGLVTMDASNAADVTKEYRDTAAEIENLKVTENRLREIMNQAVEIEDILTIENELTRVRGSISAFEKQIKNWEALVDMTTISVELNEVKSLKPKVEPIDDSLFGKAKEGLINTINGIRRSFENVVIWLITNAPILALLALAATLLSAVYKKFKKGGTKNEK